MEKKEIVEKAIQGGWCFVDGKLHWSEHEQHFYINPNDRIYIPIEVFLLDPKFFQAVGKVEGWHMDSKMQAHWKINMHRMIDALVDGKTIEEYIKTL